MHLSFVDYFVDPKNHSSLQLEIYEKDEGRIISGLFYNEKSKYPIIRGVPRFVEINNYSGSFGFQWGKWPLIQFESENIGKPMEGHTTKMFDIITNSYSKNLHCSNLLLDIGCGSGRFIDLLRSRSDVSIIGIDFSNAVDIAYDNFKNDSKICIVQADALRLPFRSNTFHSSFSIGVLHHTPSPKTGVHQVFRVLKNNGQFSICVYEKGSYYDKRILKYYRRFFTIIRPILSLIPAILYSNFVVRILGPVLDKLHFLKSFLMRIFPYTDLPDKNWAVLDTFDSVTPFYASVHTSKEVLRWLKSAGFKNIQSTDWGSTSYIAKK